MKKAVLFFILFFLVTGPAMAQHQNVNNREGSELDTAIEVGIDAGSTNGILKSDGANAISAASEGTDYIANVVSDTTPQSGGDHDMNDNWLFDNADTLAANDTTPAVTGGMFYITANTLSTSITDFVDSDGDHSEFDALETSTGMFIIVVVNDSNTIFDFTASNLSGSSLDHTATSGEAFLFVFNDATDKWHLIAAPGTVITLQRGGLGTDISAYTGLIAISGGSASEKTIGIADNNIAEIDDADAADDDFARFTANGLEGRSAAEVQTDLSLVPGTNVQAYSAFLASIDQNLGTADPAVFTSLNTGQGANELYDMDQNVQTTDAVTFATVDTGQGANELYDMDQNVLTTSAPTFATVDTGQGANELYDMDQNVQTTDQVTFDKITITGASGNGGFEIDPLPDADDTCEGIIITVTVDTNSYGIGAVLTLAADGNYDMADADAAATFGSAVACQAGTGTKEVMTRGFLRNDAGHAFTIGGLVYLSTTAGTPTQTAPVGSGDIVQIIGVAQSADVLQFAPSLYFDTLP